MNGRIYDPTLGRFLQADPHIQAPNNSQSYNRYSYVLNNPMSYTDPSGYFFKALGKFVKKNWRTIASIGLGYLTFGLGTGFAALSDITAGALISWGAAAGAVSGFVSTGSLKGALQGAFSGAIFGAIGASGLSGIESFAASGFAGGIISDVQGGKFGHGFISAGIGAAMGGRFGKNPYAQVVGSAVVGGTVSKLTGGKFANGATSAAFAAALRADWSSDTNNKTVAANKFSQNDKAAFDKDLEAVNFKVTRQQGFSSEADAAEWLHDNAHSLSVKYNAEVGGKVYQQTDGTYAVGKIVISYHSEQVSLSGSSWIGSTAANWHSHGSSYAQNGLIYSYLTFSPADLRNSNFYNNSYMSTTHLYPTQDLLFRVPSGGTNNDRCLLRGALNGVSRC